MEVDLASAVRFMPLDTFVLAHPYLFLLGDMPRAHGASATAAHRALRPVDTALPDGQVSLRTAPFAAKLRKRQPGFESLITVGRGDSCDIVIPDVTVSRVHAMFRLREDGLHLTDSGSRNGTRVDEVVLTGRASAKVTAGSRVRFGSVELTVSDARSTWEALRRSARRVG